MLISPERQRARLDRMRNVIAQLFGPPNRRLQRTALRGREIRAILKAESARASSRSISAPPLKRNTLGGAPSTLRPTNPLQLHFV
jgi:hypothetical protein